MALVAVLAACGGGTKESADGACGVLPTADPSATLPAGFPSPPGQFLYGPATQGKTHLVVAVVGTDGFVELRDDLVERLTEAGYTIAGTDQEAVEAEAEFTGPHEGTIKVQPLCTGYVTVRYKFTG